MSNETPAMAQDNFVVAPCRRGNRSRRFFPATMPRWPMPTASSIRLVAAMRYSLTKQIAGWPADDRELNTYEALRHLLRNISFGHAAHVEADYGNPTLTKMGGTNRIQFQLQSTDCNYHSAVLHGAYSYRLRGYRGSCAVFQMSTFNGHSCDFADGWKMIGNMNNVDTPALAAGSQIDVVLSHTRPTDLGNALWLELPEGRCELHIRQYYADWFTEKAADLMLTCERQSFPPQLLTQETSEARFKRLVDLLRVHADFLRRGSDGASSFAG